MMGDGSVRRFFAFTLLLTGLSLVGHALPVEAADPSGDAAETSLPEPADPDVRAREREALITFYEALGGPDWIQRDFWGSDRPVGEWHGVETDSEGRVVRLTIYDNNLVGVPSPAICQLERLHTLHLSFNKISGPLPEALGACRALKNLWLKGNKLTGPIPDSVAQLPELEYLDVHANSLSGPLPTIWNTPKLEIFRGEDNGITGALPEQLFQQPNLEQVFLHSNKLTGPLPGTLSAAANLHSLLLADNMLSGPIPKDIGRLSKLTDLRLNKNQLSGSIPDSLAGAASLQVLRLDDNRLTGPVPEGLADHLTVFDVSGNPGLEASP
jgi:Leucine-rich repeat (LRR) protein